MELQAEDRSKTPKWPGGPAAVAAEQAAQQQLATLTRDLAAKHGVPDGPATHPGPSVDAVGRLLAELRSALGSAVGLVAL